MSAFASPERFVQRLQRYWWVSIPARLRRVSLLFSEIWRDGTYLAALPAGIGLGLPLLALLLGEWKA